MNNQKLILSKVLMLIISFLIISALLKNINLQKIVLQDIYYWPIIFIIVLTGIAYFLRSTIYRLFLLPNKQIASSMIFKITGIYAFLTALFPFGIGHLSYPYFIKKYCNISIISSLNSLLLYNLLRILLLFILFFFSAFKIINVATVFSRLIEYKIELFILAGLIILSVMVGIFFKYSNEIRDKRRSGFFNKAIEGVKSLFSFNLQFIPVITLLTACIIGVNLLCFYFIFLVVGINLSYLDVCFLFSLNHISFILPIHFASSFGSFELINSFGMVLIGFDLNQAIQLSFAVHLVGLIIQALFALLCYLSIRLSSHSMIEY